MINSKLPDFGNRASDVEKFLKLSLERLNLQYVDMYLIHSPTPFIQDKDKYGFARDKDGKVIFDENTDHVSTWKVYQIFSQLKNLKKCSNRRSGLIKCQFCVQ